MTTGEQPMTDAIDRLQADYEASMSGKWFIWEWDHETHLSAWRDEPELLSGGSQAGIGGPITSRDAAHIVSIHNSTSALLAIAKAAAKIEEICFEEASTYGDDALDANLRGAALTLRDALQALARSVDA